MSNHPRHLPGRRLRRARSSSRHQLSPAGVIASVLWLGLVLVPAQALGSGGDLLWSFQGIENIVAMAEADDHDGDLVPEVAVETYDAGATGDHLYLLRGASSGTADVLWSVRPFGGPSNSGGWGDDCLNLGADVTGDGRRDLLLGTAWGGRTAYGIDAEDGASIWSFDTYADAPPTPPESGWVYTVHGIDDLTGDSIADAIFGAGSENNGAYAVDGSSGAPIYRLNATDAIVSAAAIGDVTGDGLAEAVFGGGDFEERAFCVSGASDGVADLVWQRTLDDGTQHLDAIADLDGDGLSDVLVGTWGGTVWALSGADGAVVWTHPVGTVVMRVVPLADVDGDAIPDAAVASWDNATRVISGADGALIWRTPSGDDVWAVDAMADVTGDGRPEVVAGSFDGNVSVLDGTSGAILWSFPTGNRVFTVRGVGDLSGNGIPDAVAGTQFLNGSGGKVYALEGNDAAGVSLPLVAAHAVAHGVLLEWDARDLAAGSLFHVDRRPQGVAHPTPERLAMKHALAAAALPRHERLALAATMAGGAAYQRLTVEPLIPEDGAVRFIDRTADPAQGHLYRVAFREPGQVSERYLPEVLAAPSVAGAARLAVIPVGPAGRPHGFRVVAPQGATGYSLALYAVDGRRVRALEAGMLGGEPRDIPFDGRDAQGTTLARGVYFVELVTAAARVSGKFLWLP